ncbi:hypothetical protein, partial [Nostoc sp. DedVER01b]|uniref:hypothetical protein n=1 Tax=Nostoc sp. DedVER01b TaxID=3075404 RepID=UPI002AD29161
MMPLLVPQYRLSFFSNIQKDRRITVIGSIAWLLAISAPIVESDVYRYSLLLLAATAGYYFRKLSPRPKLDWLGLLCVAWAAYAVVRFCFFLFFDKDHSLGGSEWLYFFPAL